MYKLLLQKLKISKFILNRYIRQLFCSTRLFLEEETEGLSKLGKVHENILNNNKF